MVIRTGRYFPNQQWVLLPGGMQLPAKAQAMWHLMYKPETCARRDIMLIFFSDIKGALFRSDVEDVIAQLTSKMGPVVAEDDCKAKQPEPDEHYLNHDINDDLEIGGNDAEQFANTEYDAAHFASGTEIPPPVRPFRRPPLSSFTIRKFGLVGFDEPKVNDHHIDPPVNLEEFYGDDDDDDKSTVTFSTNDGHTTTGDADDDSNEGDDDGDDGNGEYVDGIDGGDIDDEDCVKPQGPH